MNEADKPQCLRAQGPLRAGLCDFYRRRRESCWCLSCAMASDFKGCGSRTRDKQCLLQEGLTLLHKKHLLLIPNAVPRHPQFKMRIYKNLQHNLVPILQPKCHVVRLILVSGLFNVMFYYPLWNKTWNFIFTNCLASLGSNSRETRFKYLSVIVFLFCVIVKINW